MKKTVLYLIIIFSALILSCTGDDGNSVDAVLIIETLDVNGNPRQGVEIEVAYHINIYPDYDFPLLITDQNGEARYIPEDFFFDDDETPRFAFYVPYSIGEVNVTSLFELTAIKGESVSRTIQDE